MSQRGRRHWVDEDRGRRSPAVAASAAPKYAEADDLGIRQIKLLRNQRCAHNFGIASPMRADMEDFCSYLILRHCMFLPISLSPLSGEETVMEGPALM
uniref:Uncharacterized protein n=1 Tax=Oryza nivara TaxID=4536 RepID=A0A0E0GJ43_ORYNI